MIDNSPYDLIVIGAGASGSTVAADAIRRGARVALIEQWKVGGTCLNAGCDPTKTLVRSAQIMHLARTSSRFGIDIGEVALNWPAVLERVNGVIDTIRGGDGDQNVRDSGVHLFKGHASFLGSHEITVNNQRLRAERFVIATGATTTIPKIEGLDQVPWITNIEAVQLPELPRSMAIIGGGIIACEFAQIFSRFGVEVRLLGRAPHLLPREEPELTVVLREILDREGIVIRTGVEISRVARDGDETILYAKTEGGEREVCRAELLLIAAGRHPVVSDLGLEKAGVEFDAKNGISVNAYLQTTANHIWAVGDCLNTYPFTHVADYQARIAEHNALSGLPERTVDERVVPWAIFTDPELARVGMTEAQALEAGHTIHTATVRLNDIVRAITSDQREGLVKLVVDAENGQILGGHILAAEAGELIAEIALAMRAGLPIAEISNTIHAYPTLTEAVFWTSYQITHH